MTQQPRQMTTEHFRLLAELAGLTMPEERVRRAAGEVAAVLQVFLQMRLPNLRDVEPAVAFHLPWDDSR